MKKEILDAILLTILFQGILETLYLMNLDK